jgi:uncharacterized protein
MRWHTREDSGIRLDREGGWWHDGERVDHPKIVEAFNRGLAPTEDGRFTLTFGNDWCFVEVEDAAYTVLGIEQAPEGAPRLSLSDRTSETLAPDTLETDRDGALTCRVKVGRAKARFSRTAQAALGEALELRDGSLWLRLGSQRVRIPAH